MFRLSRLVGYVSSREGIYIYFHIYISLKKGHMVAQQLPYIRELDAQYTGGPFKTDLN